MWTLVVSQLAAGRYAYWDTTFPVQATAAYGFRLALIDLDKKLAGQEATIVHILHDEIIVEARDDVADHVAAVAKECMERTLLKSFQICHLS